MKQVYIENEAVTVEVDGKKTAYGTFADAAQALGIPNEAEAMVEAIEANGKYEVT